MVRVDINSTIFGPPATIYCWHLRDAAVVSEIVR